MNLYVTGVLWVAGVALVAGTLAYLVRRIGATEGVVENNEAAGQVFTLVGGLQAVLLAFVLISLFDGASAAEDGSYREADSLVATVWAVDALPSGSSEIASEARAYAREVVTQEWPRMRDGRPVDDTGWTTLARLRKAVADAPAPDDWTVNRKTEAATRLWQVYQARQDRINAAGEGVNSVVWFAMVVGAVMAVALPLLFGGPKPATHIFIVSILAGTMTMLLFATQQLQNPYGGGAQVSPAAFESALDHLG